ncbi:MAG: tetratricopeptide repeat protein [Rikenellaceae bacterium]|jgi:tetratricopeptide (TPR) repeat protein|nr:tetratricopeptide repeat protein [Rikenellaceae bacterium]
MNNIILTPTGGEEYVIEGGDFGRALVRSTALETAGKFEEACRIRFEAFQQLMAVVPENEECNLSWEDGPTRDGLTLVKFSAIDHFLVGDMEMAAGMLELLLDLDPEDHLDATTTLAYCYVALGEDELFDEAVADLPEQSADRALLMLWSAFRRTGSLPPDGLEWLGRDFPALLAEFRADNHPADELYLADIEAAHPSQQARARELWLRTEHLWRRFHGFVEALKAR